MKIVSKARTLDKLKIKGAIIPQLKIFQSRNFLNNKEKITSKIKNNFKKYVAIRSSSADEDQINKSNAGKFLSFLNISSKNEKDLSNKITKVIKSYKKNIHNSEFFVQEMVQKIKISGVILTRELENYLPCYNINYYVGKDSSAVTAGKEGSKNIIYIDNKKYKINKEFKKLIEVVKEIKKKTKQSDLDIEFAVDISNRIYILQIRQLVIKKDNKKLKLDPEKLFLKLEKKIKKLKQKHYSLYGETTYFGVMPDWNPAEIIGIKPRPLALSLYQELITDHIWSQNRKIYGYKDLSQFHLMTTFYGTPFVDVRIDFNSWLPNSLSKNLSHKIINFYLKTFKQKKYLHDKVEFEILLTCYTLNTKKKIKERFKQLLNNQEQKTLINCLKQINIKANQQMKVDYSMIANLIENQNKIEKSSLYYLDKIYWLIEDCKKYGTLPFAGLARCAFIATEILNSFVEEKIITNDEKINFLASIKTITTEMNEDLHKNKKSFIKKYGHLRPGTYEITSLNYRKNFKNYFSKNYYKQDKKNNNIFNFSSLQKNKINIFVKESNIYKNFDDLIDFIKKSIKYREYSKFIFSKSIDLIFNNIQDFGLKFNIKNDDLSYLSINNLLELYFNLSNTSPIKKIKNDISANKKEYASNKNISLPDVITEAKDLFVQIRNDPKINFISNKSIVSKIYEYNKINLKGDISGVICIENADPGYDFLFSKNIKGLVTKYGGQNSHMAIRCAELNLPALIGVGEQIYNKITNNRFIKIDCNLKKIDFIA
jgi:phosphohistidine swiveling domain-containing protein